MRAFYNPCRSVSIRGSQPRRPAPRPRSTGGRPGPRRDEAYPRRGHVAPTRLLPPDSLLSFPDSPFCESRSHWRRYYVLPRLFVNPVASEMERSCSKWQDAAAHRMDSTDVFSVDWQCPSIGPRGYVMAMALMLGWRARSNCIVPWLGACVCGCRPAERQSIGRLGRRAELSKRTQVLPKWQALAGRGLAKPSKRTQFGRVRPPKSSKRTHGARSDPRIRANEPSEPVTPPVSERTNPAGRVGAARTGRGAVSALPRVMAAPD